EKIGRIEEGYAADLVVLDGSSPRMNPCHSPTSNVVYSATGADVKHVLVGGEPVVRDGRVTTVDEEEVLEHARECAEQLAGD
ncbi:MAG: amidohydrolase family protein, partial [Euryarchaeota archaeon]